MNIINKEKEVLIDLQQYEDTYVGGNYIIYNTDVNGCRKDVITSGKIDSDIFSLTLPDGSYEINIIKDNFADLNEFFTVYYNYLIIFVCEFKKLICCQNCNECGGNNKDKLNELFYKSLIHFNCNNLFNTMPFTKSIFCKQAKILDKKTEYNTYYGKFTFDYEKNIKDILISIYLELYYNTLNKLRKDNSELEDINRFFQIESIKICLYNQNIDIEEIKCEINNLNCSCDEL